MYKSPDKNIWRGRIDAEDGSTGLRWHQMVECIDLAARGLPALEDIQTGFALIGFRCDEGVRRNKGRTGAVDGPEAIRTASVNFAWHFNKNHVRLLDCGDVVCEDNKLEEAQEELSDRIKLIIQEGYYPLILGGGHEVSFGGFKGVSNDKRFKDKAIGIINFDAHFDLRDFSEQASSGTPFLQIAELCSTNQKPFRYMSLGIQPQSNTETLFRKANELKVEYVLGNDLIEQNVPNIEYAITKYINKSNGIYLTVDLDVFDISNAPGVSAPAVPGIDKKVMLRVLKIILDSGKVVACDIAEMNPAFDSDGRTANLAAFLLYEITHHLSVQSRI